MASNSNLAAAQNKITQNNEPALKLLVDDVKTRWWLMHTMTERVLMLKNTIKLMFKEEF